MKVWDIVPYSTDKNLGKAYNEAMALIPDEDTVCFRDGDTCWLTPDYGMILHHYAELHPNAILTCWTNRINEKAEQQYKGVRDINNMVEQCLIAEDVKKNLYKTTLLHGFISGFCMVIPKHIWHQHKFSESQVYEDRGPHNLLGVDNDFTNRVRASGIPVLRMDGLYIWHTYRLLTNSKEHLM